MVVGLEEGGYNVGEVVAGTRGRERTISGVDDQPWTVPWACEE